MWCFSSRSSPHWLYHTFSVRSFSWVILNIFFLLFSAISITLENTDEYHATKIEVATLFPLCNCCQERILMCSSGNHALIIIAFTIITHSLFLWHASSLLTCKPTLPLDLYTLFFFQIEYTDVVKDVQFLIPSYTLLTYNQAFSFVVSSYFHAF